MSVSDVKALKKVKKNNNKKEIKIAFIADDVKSLNEFGIIHNTTFGLILAVQKLINEGNNLRLLLTESNKLNIRNGKVYAVFDEIRVLNKPGNYLKILNSREYELSSVSIIFARKDPPFDQNYLSFIQTLSLVPHYTTHPFLPNKKRTLIINNPEGILKANEKLYALNFKDVIPPTLVSSDKTKLLDFLKKHKEAVIKPLFNKGGEGVFRINIKDKNFKAVINSALKKDSTILIQKYLPEVVNGDKRIILLNGKVVGGIVRIPQKGEFRAHISRGAKYRRLLFLKNDLKICRKLKPYLQKDGIYFAGIDVIGNHLIEINVTCPANLRETGESVGRDLSCEVIQWAIKTV